MKTVFSFFLVFSFFAGYAQNIIIDSTGNPNEPSIMFDPLRPNVIIAGSNISNYYLSNDTGRTWTEHQLQSSHGVWGDPVIDVDPAGNFYFFHLSNPPTGNWIDRIVCQKTTDDGATWSDGSYTGLNGTKVQDKQWSIIDRNNGDIYLTWTQFDKYASSNPLDSSFIMFSKSTDAGATWSNAKIISAQGGDCIDSDSTVEGATPALGPNGELYVAWAGPNGLVFNKSLDSGATWLNKEIAIDAMPGGWDLDIPGILRGNGLPILKCDLSGGANNGTLYLNWADQRNGAADTDIWFSKSTDKGDTWSLPTRVNNDVAGKHQFFTWMDIDQTTGYLYFVFYDRRNHQGVETDVYMAVSKDGGNSFVNFKISDSPFIPINTIFFGDYTNIVAHNNIIRPIWTRLDGPELTIMTDITPIDIYLSNPEYKDLLQAEIKTYPNPWRDDNYVSFKLRKTSTIDLLIYNQQGKVVSIIINSEKMDMGKHIIPIRVKELHLPSGSYYYKLSINGKSMAMKTILID